jgi:hypothetical protein
MLCGAGTYSLGGTATACTSCPAGLYGATAGLPTAGCTGPCPAGSYCPARSAAPTPCPGGYWSGAQASSCSLCAGGRYGSTAGLTSAACSGMCSAGTYCPAGTSSPLACPLGAYCLAASANFTLCPVGLFASTIYTTTAGCSGSCQQGRYGNTTGQTSNQCSGPCDAGRFGALTGLNTSSCSGPCTAGYACPAGSISPTATVCSVGQYSLSGAGTCWLCPAGRYGSNTASASGNCTGSCAPGYACPAGSSSPTALACAVGSYSVGGAGACSLCPFGVFGTSTGMSSPNCTSPCPPGRFGNVTGETRSTCAGELVSANKSSLGWLACTSYQIANGCFSTGPCQDGFYCPAGSTASASLSCPVGYYCSAAVSVAPVLCPAGRYGSTIGLPTADCSGPCDAGRCVRLRLTCEMGNVYPPDRRQDLPL